MLELVRKNPLIYAQQLATSEKLGNGGTYGMFAHWQDVVKLLHTGELNLSEGLKELQGKFVRFNENIRNQKKQEDLLEQFIKYSRAYEKLKFEFVNSKKQIKWEFSSQGILTGLTPWVVKNAKSYYSYFFVEEPINWNKELKYPLIVEYLSKNILKCEISKLQIGVYCLKTNTFEFKNYQRLDIYNSINEIQQIFNIVETEYNKTKKNIKI
jgi:hypothetical protein